MKRQKTKIKDVFAEIAATPVDLRTGALVEPQPPELPEKFLALDKRDQAAVFDPVPKIDTPAKLERELARRRRAHEKFMRNLAPELPETTRRRIYLDEFDWRLESKTGRENSDKFTDKRPGRWRKIRLPHFGPPLGRAAACYRGVFDLSGSRPAGGRVFICFKGVDYKAQVFVNDSYLGSHEGFFAPFEFDFTRFAQGGRNRLEVRVENDAVCGGNASWDGGKYEGDKIYAATGPGYDESELGWHHCPPGMGIYQDVFVEIRSCIHIHDIFVRPLLERKQAEAWIEVNNCGLEREDISLELSVYGQNFRKTVLREQAFAVPGAGPGVNFYRLLFDVPDPKLWSPQAPWLYQIQIEVWDKAGKNSRTGEKDGVRKNKKGEKRGGLLDAAVRHFGMRSFTMEEKEEPKGLFRLNGRPVRLRGANTMGHLQQCVMRKDWGQLRDDILLAKICHMNFFRLTQRPVQPEIYEYCDRLGMMTQTDLPLFGVLRRNQFCEAVKQAEEMERLVRAHPCNIMLSYINEPSLPHVWEKDKAHRHLTRSELESFFAAADKAVHLNNPDRVIKPVDGDYNPPAPSGLPDNHCYCGWYNGHGLDLGKLHKGWWQKVKPGWLYGCGEFGAEGLDPVETMRKYYPGKWLPRNKSEEKEWTPLSISRAQTGTFHYLWFDTQHSLEDWVRASQEHQAWVIRLMAEAFRRDSRMVSQAVHLFIDAWPAGWMKAIMDTERCPKPAYFAYRQALTPLMLSLRTDRYSFFSGEKICLEAWICNDLDTAPQNTFLHYQVEMAGKVILAQRCRATMVLCGSEFQGRLCFRALEVEKRSRITVRLGLADDRGEVIYDTAVELTVFPQPEAAGSAPTVIIGSRSGSAFRLAQALGLRRSFFRPAGAGDIILIDDMVGFHRQAENINRAVRAGAVAVFTDIPAGRHKIAGGEVKAAACARNARHFVSRDTGHPLAVDFTPDDFRFWYDDDKGYVTPFLPRIFIAPGWSPILSSGQSDDWQNDWYPCFAAAEKRYGKGWFRICSLELANRVRGNPAARLFAQRLVRV